MTDLEKMRVRPAKVTFKGGPLTLLGGEVHVGSAAPDVEVQANDLSMKKISDYRGHILVLSAVPSLDTPVCSVETRRFNQEAAGLGENVRVLTISMDLPFAQKRWCAAEGIDRVETLSDHFHAVDSCIWQRAPQRCPRYHGLRARKPIRRGRCAWSCRFRPAVRPTSPRACLGNGCRSGLANRSSSRTVRARPAISAPRRSRRRRRTATRCCWR
jgi:peroxiredoxin